MFTSVVYINCWLDWSVLNEMWRARICGKGKTFNTKLPKSDMTSERLIELTVTKEIVIMIPHHYEYKMMTL